MFSRSISKYQGAFGITWRERDTQNFSDFMSFDFSPSDIQSSCKAPQNAIYFLDLAAEHRIGSPRVSHVRFARRVRCTAALSKVPDSGSRNHCLGVFSSWLTPIEHLK